MKKHISLLLFLVLALLEGFSQWTSVFSTSDMDTKIEDISFVNDSVGYAVGSHYYFNELNMIENIIWKTQDFGTTWDTILIEELHCPCSDRGLLSGVDFLDADHGWVSSIQSDTLLYTSDGGLSWQKIDTGLHELLNGWVHSDDYGDVDFSSPNFGIAFSEGEQHCMKTEDGGLTWTLFDEIVGYDLHLIDSCNFGVANSGLTEISQSCNVVTNTFYPAFEEVSRTAMCIHILTPSSYLIGTLGLIGFDNFGSIMRTVDGGLTFSFFDMPFTQQTLEIVLTNNGMGYALLDPVNDDKFILKTNDFGNTWYEQEFAILPSLYGQYLNNLQITSDQVAFVHTGNAIYRTLNGGGPLGEMHVAVSEQTRPQEIDLYPNPASESIRIAGLPADFRGSISLFDARGVLLGVQSGVNWDVNKLAPGIYTLYIVDGERRQVLRFVRE